MEINETNNETCDLGNWRVGVEGWNDGPKMFAVY